jgi:perosamine synthetase
MINGPINPSIFGAAGVDGSPRLAALQVLADQELFRYRSDTQLSWNDRLERGLAAWSHCPAAVAVNSGTTGLRVALKAVGVGPGDHVLVSAYTFVATAMAVAALGAVPEPLDTNDLLGVELDDLAARLHPKIRAVVVVHVQGHLADISPVKEVLKSEGIAVVEDACQGFGASSFGRPAGSMGDLGVFSFHQAKQIAAGEGGAIVAKNRDLATACARYVDMGASRDAAGWPNWDDSTAILGENCRLSELQAAVLCAQLNDLPQALARQRAIRGRIANLLELQGVPVAHGADPDGDSASHLLVPAQTPEHALAIIKQVREHDVLARLVWDRPYYRHGVFGRAGLTPEQLRVAPAVRAEALAPRLLSLPMSPSLPDEAAEQVANVIAAAWRTQWKEQR